MHPTQLQMHRLISPYAKASYRVDRIGQSASRTNLHGYTLGIERIRNKNWRISIATQRLCFSPVKSSIIPAIIIFFKNMKGTRMRKYYPTEQNVIFRQ